MQLQQAAAGRQILFPFEKSGLLFTPVSSFQLNYAKLSGSWQWLQFQHTKIRVVSSLLSRKQMNYSFNLYSIVFLQNLLHTSIIISRNKYQSAAL